MKITYLVPILFVLLICGNSCDKNFTEINTNPVLSTSMDPEYLFSSAQISTDYYSLYYDGAIVQQTMCLFGGQPEGGNRNTVIDINGVWCWNNLYNNPVKNLVYIIEELKDNSNRTNLYNMSRIWKAYCFLVLVDTYGDVPYFEAGKAALSNLFLPKYDDQKVIYDDLRKELTEATDALDATKDVVKGDIFYGGNIPKWKKLGNSILLRLGMRYTKIDDSKAKGIVIVATDPARGGLMSSNGDNAIIKFNATFNNLTTTKFVDNIRHNSYIGKPFLDFLKNNSDPRLNFIAVLYSTPETASGGTANTNVADQIGCPFGYTDITIVDAPGFPGKVGGAFKYSQFNRTNCVRLDSWSSLVTYSQTQFLLAEARQRGYISTSTTKNYYEAGIKGHMTQLDIFSTTGSASSITTAQQDAYLAQPAIAFDPANALRQINEQYWVASFLIWSEAWANFRRSGYPQLSPINFPGEDPAVKIATGGDGFIHRLEYPVREKSANTANLEEAAVRMGGNNMGIRLFWDTK